MKNNIYVLLALLLCTGTIVAQNIPSYLPADGLVGWWPFNGNANDESGNGNHGVVNGATLTSDRIGNANSAYNFDGVNDFISATRNYLFNNEISISCWFKENATNEQVQIIGCWDNPLSGPDNRLITLYLNSDITKGDIATTANQINVSAITQNTLLSWHNVSMVYDGQELKLYQDGIVLSSSPSSANFKINQSPLWIIGAEAYLNSYGYFMQGDIDDIAIYNRALTQEEITALYTGVYSNNDNGSAANVTVPASISYQAVARNAQGQALANSSVQVKFTLLADSINGSSEYVELHSLTTNALGLFTTAFGNGTPLSGTFANIHWASGNKYLKVEMDAGGGFISIGTQQMLSVPYSIRSQSSATIINNALPVYSDNADALAAGLQAGEMYRTATGDLKIVY
jgi:hypothetical protein